MSGALNPTRWLSAPWGGGFNPAPGVEIAPHLRLVRPVTGASAYNVWVAHQQVLQIEVAVKFSAPEPAADAAHSPGAGREELSRFLRQARSAARVGDPHLVQILEQGQVQGVPFLVTELLEGRSLRQRLLSGPLSLPEVQAVLVQAAGVLAKAHPLGLWHGSLCAEHLFAGEAAGELFLKISNFADVPPEGFARGPSSPQLSETPAPLLTHLAPEHLRLGGASAAADLWALGVTVYELLTTILPFEAATPDAIEAAIRGGQLAPPSRYRADVSPALDAWFARVFTPQPARRWHDPLELAREFLRASEGAELLASGVAPVYGAPPAEVERLSEVGGDQDEDERTRQWDLPYEDGVLREAPEAPRVLLPEPPRAASLPSVPPPLPNRLPSSRPPPVVARPSQGPPSLAELAQATQPAGFADGAARASRLSKARGLIGGALLGGAGALLAWGYQGWSESGSAPVEAVSAETRTAPLGTSEAARTAARARPGDSAEELRIVQTDDLPQAPDELPEETDDWAVGAGGTKPAPVTAARRGGEPAKSEPKPAPAAKAATSRLARPEPRAVPSRGRPSAAAARKPPQRRSTKQVSASASCNPPYFFDNNNIRRLKLECL